MAHARDVSSVRLPSDLVKHAAKLAQWDVAFLGFDVRRYGRVSTARVLEEAARIGLAQIQAQADARRRPRRTPAGSDPDAG
ncbi:MAG: hypothetical protein ABII82_13360 [Verrucomicrobiota bacterium]